MKIRIVKVIILTLILMIVMTSAVFASVSRFAGMGEGGHRDGAVEQAKFSFPYGIVFRGEELLVADSGNNLIRSIKDGKVTTLAGKIELKDLAGSALGGLRDGKVEQALFNNPRDLAVDSAGKIYVADTKNHVIRKIDGVNVTTFAGTGVAGYKDGKSNEAQFNNPASLCIDAAGNLYVADMFNNVIRKITPEGEVTTYAGVQAETGSLQNGELLQARFNEPTKVRFTPTGELLVLDSGNQRIRRITSAGLVENFAGGSTTKLAEGNYYEGGYRDGAAPQALFNFPKGFSVTSGGVVFVADTWNHRLRAVMTDNNVVTVAGSGVPGELIGQAAGSVFNGPVDVLYAAGKIYISDSYNHTIKVMNIDPNNPAIAGGSAVATTNVEVYINSNRVRFPDATPLLENGRTILPLRAICEAMGAQINWLSEGRSVEISSGGTVKRFTLGVDPLEIRGERTMVQIRFLSENLGYKVDWDNKMKAVLIKK